MLLLRYLIVLAVVANLKRRLKVFPVSHLSIGCLTLIALMNPRRDAVPDTLYSEYFLFSSA